MKIFVLGLGNSLRHYTPDGSVTIGVNDVYKIHSTDYVVCVDRPNRFSRDRLTTILQSTPKKFFTHLYSDWRMLVNNLQEIKMADAPGCDHLTSSKICYSNNSTFVACVIAYKLGAKEIVLHGCDFIDHPNFTGKSLHRALKDFNDLYLKLKSVGVRLYVGSPESRLSDFIPVLRQSN